MYARETIDAISHTLIDMERIAEGINRKIALYIHLSIQKRVRLPLCIRGEIFFAPSFSKWRVCLGVLIEICINNSNN